MHYREHAEASPAALGREAAYRTFCARVGLEPHPGGYGFVHAVDNDGERWTMITTDLDYHRALVTASDETRAGLTIPPGVYTLKRKGWPDEWVRQR
jgi:hypothetical protein